jgi:hypothetical protein
MGTDNIHHRLKAKREYARKSREISPKHRILIVCEGAKTEPNYFRAFPCRGDLVKIEVHGEGKNTVSLVKEAKKLVRNAKFAQEEFDEIWCVFDKDSFPEFNTAIEMCRQTKNFYAAYSNEAFELWYMLHFDYHDSATSRHVYSRLLSKKLGERYRKNSDKMYSVLLPMQETAVINARRLLESYSEHNPADDNPCTTVFMLVEKLNEYL